MACTQLHWSRWTDVMTRILLALLLSLCTFSCLGPHIEPPPGDCWHLRTDAATNNVVVEVESEGFSGDWFFGMEIAMMFCEDIDFNCEDIDWNDGWYIELYKGSCPYPHLTADIQDAIEGLSFTNIRYAVTDECLTSEQYHQRRVSPFSDVWVYLDATSVGNFQIQCSIEGWIYTFEDVEIAVTDLDAVEAPRILSVSISGEYRAPIR